MSKLWKLEKSDFVKGGVVAVLVAVLTLITELLKAKGLSLDSSDLQNILSTAVLTLIAYLGKNVATDEEGKILGKI